MRRIKRFILWRMTPLCLLAVFCAAPLWLASAQSGQLPEGSLPGVPAGYTIIEGDIQMPISVANAMRRGTAPEAGYSRNRLWPNGIIPFQFETTCAVTSTCAGALPSGCVSAANQTAMLNAMAVLEAAANLDFRQCPNNRCSGNFVHIRDSINDTTVGSGNSCQDASRNSSPVGMQGGRQTINIVNWETQFIIVHELLHTLGFFHEQSRPDRDTFVDVASLCANVTGGCMGSTYLANFPIDNGATAYGYYDFDSVMHYGQCSFSRNPNCPTTSMAFPDGGITIKVNPPYNAQLSPDGVPWQNLDRGLSAIGQRRRLSELDRLTLSFLYPRPNWRFVDGSFPARPALDGTFLIPFISLQMGINATPAGGVLWIQPGSYRAPRTITKNITLRAPLGGVTLLPPLQGTAGETLASVSAASYNGELASESIAAAFGANLAEGTATATSLPLPTTLGGVTVKVKDSEGTERDAPLFFVSPGQINYLVPAGSSAGIANVSVFKGSARAANTTVPITSTAPALFTANASGQGVPAAVVLRVRGEAQTIEPLSRYDEVLKQFVPVPIDLGPEGDQVFLILFGTGFRAADSSEAISVMIGGESAEVFFAGATPGFAGLDQANVMLPRSLAGKGEVSVEFVAGNRSANEVIVSIR
ncbi:MAG: M12 family metallopeptidase [Blastocatellia bacterium]